MQGYVQVPSYKADAHRQTDRQTDSTHTHTHTHTHTPLHTRAVMHILFTLTLTVYKAPTVLPTQLHTPYYLQRPIDFVASQIISKPPFSFDVVYKPVTGPAASHSQSPLSGKAFTDAMEKKKQEFDRKFEGAFQLKAKVSFPLPIIPMCLTSLQYIKLL